MIVFAARVRGTRAPRPHRTVDRLEAAASVRPVGFAPLRGLVDPTAPEYPVEGSPRPDGVEVLETRFVSREEATALLLPAWMAEVLEDVFAEREGAFRPCGVPPSGE